MVAGIASRVTIAGTTETIREMVGTATVTCAMVRNNIVGRLCLVGVFWQLFGFVYRPTLERLAGYALCAILTHRTLLLLETLVSPLVYRQLRERAYRGMRAVEAFLILIADCLLSASGILISRIGKFVIAD